MNDSPRAWHTSSVNNTKRISFWECQKRELLKIHSQNTMISSHYSQTKIFLFSLEYHTNALCYHPNPCQNEVIFKHLLLLISGYRCCVLRCISSNQRRLELCSGSGEFLRFWKIPMCTREISSGVCSNNQTQTETWAAIAAVAYFLQHSCDSYTLSFPFSVI